MFGAPVRKYQADESLTSLEYYKPKSIGFKIVISIFKGRCTDKIQYATLKREYWTYIFRILNKNQNKTGNVYGGNPITF